MTTWLSPFSQYCKFILFLFASPDSALLLLRVLSAWLSCLTLSWLFTDRLARYWTKEISTSSQGMKRLFYNGSIFCLFFKCNYWMLSRFLKIPSSLLFLCHSSCGNKWGKMVIILIPTLTSRKGFPKTSRSRHRGEQSTRVFASSRWLLENACFGPHGLVEQSIPTKAQCS